MQQFTGLEYIKIDIANQLGYDKLNWDERIEKAESYLNTTSHSERVESNPLLYKALIAHDKAIKGKPTGFIMGLDATASGIQIMSCLMGCETSAKSVNLIDTGSRRNVYNIVRNIVSAKSEHHYTLTDIKKPVMTTFYGSKNQPKELFGEGTPDLDIFYKTLNTLLPGAMECMNDMQSCWNPKALVHAWTLPDGHVAYVPVMDNVDKKIEIDELNHATFTHRAYVNKPLPRGLSLAANIVHSIDGFVVREMIRRAHYQHFNMITIHDSFWSSPNYMNKVRQNYLDILMEIADMNLLDSILKSITNSNIEHVKISNSMSQQMVDAEYAIC